ncbi:MAG: GAF domain-containing protein, partial [Gallionella sp.]|nr:GAF domain-containing protein [Gallionella sp.]
MPSKYPRSGGLPNGHVPIERFLSAPALAGEELMGQISLANADRDYTDHDLAVVERLADFYAIVVQRVRSEKALRDSEAFTKSVLDNLPVGIAVNSVEPSVTFSYMNDIFPKFYRTTRDKLADPDAFWDTVYEDPEFRKNIRKQVLEDCASGDVERMHWDDVPITRKGEETVFVTARNIPVPDKRLMISMVWDVTERKQAEVATQHANRALATLSAVNHELVHATDETELLQAICQVIVEQRGYRMACVGYVQHDESKSIKIMAHAGHQGYLETMQLTWAETERGMGPSGRAVRSSATQVCQDIANDPQYLPWRDEALKCGCAAAIALPLKSRDDTVFGILHVYAGEVNAFTPAEISLLEEMADDLAFGVHTLHVRQERDLTLVKNQEQLVQLQDSMEDTMRAIASIVEMRDPYTAGHQIKVADLAAAIAKQMGLPEEQAHAIHLAGTVHDLGKINIPAEILSKPGKIT